MEYAIHDRCNNDKISIATSVASSIFLSLSTSALNAPLVKNKDEIIS